MSLFKKNIHWLPLLFILILMTGCVSPNKLSKESDAYYCPMMCEGEKTYDKPGSCPVCGMDLVKMEKKVNTENRASQVNISGAMMNVMHKGELFGTIDLDTLSGKKHLYGLGPVEYLRGEILVIDGKSYVSRVAANGALLMEETIKVKAPFFVYENVESWKELVLPDTIQTVTQLETFLDQNTQDHVRPFTFRVTATVEHGEIHIVNLPPGTPVHSPEEAHSNQKTYELRSEKVEMIGFYSTEHQGIFTHHDSHVHIHLITADKKKMGHVDEVKMKQGTTRLYVSSEK